MKKGIYIKACGGITSHNIIAFCLKNSYKVLGLKNQYIEIGRKCNGSNPLIKEIIAVPGDTVTLSDQYIEVNRIKYPYKTQYIDSKGRKLAVYPRGHYANTRDYWVIGTNARNSWDSRYFGPISKNQILYKLKPLLIW